MSGNRWQIDAESIRSRVSDVNDGVLAVAGLAEGLVHVVDAGSLPTIIMVGAVAGSISAAGARLTEEMAELEVQQKVIQEEKRLLELTPEEELEELTEHFQSKGVTQATARQVAEELSAADALSAQLETEYGISEVIGRTQPYAEAIRSGLSFLLGATVPVLIALLVPRQWLEEYVLLGVGLSLTVTAIVLSRLGQTRVLPTILRSLFIGMAALGASVLAGYLLG